MKRKILIPIALMALGFTTTYAQELEEKFAGWYMRTKVSATAADDKVYEHNTAGVFGKLKQSIYKLDKHDIPSYGPATLQVVFPQTNWGDENNGDYWSDYRQWKSSTATKRTVWKFQIKNQHTVDLSHAPITIELDGKQNLNFTEDENGKITYIETKLKPWKRKDFTLVDVDNDFKKYSYDEIENADLNMDGKHTRTFKWIFDPNQD